MVDLPVIHLCLFGCGLVVNSAPTRVGSRAWSLTHIYLRIQPRIVLYSFCYSYHGVASVMVIEEDLENLANDIVLRALRELDLVF